MLLESKVTTLEVKSGAWYIENQQLNLLPLMHHLLSCDAITGANVFHGTLIAALTDWLQFWSQKTNIFTVLLSGGCFLNKVLTEGLLSALERININAYIQRQLPPNDGGLCLGQAWALGSTL